MISYYLFSFLLWPLIAIVAVIFIIARIRGHRKQSAPGEALAKDWHTQLSLSKEDGTSQTLLVLSVIFLGVALLALNRDFGEPLGWRTILFAASALAIAGAYWQRAAQLLVIGLIGIASWWGSALYLWVDGKNLSAAGIFVGLTFAALLFYTIGRLHDKRPNMKRFALIYSGLGLVAVTGTLFFLSTKYGISIIGEMTRGATFLGSWQLSISLFVLALAIVGTAFVGFGQKVMTLPEVFAVVVLTCLFGSIALLSPQTMFSGGSYYSGNALTDSGAFWAIIYNVAIFVELVGLILSGYARRQPGLVNLGAAFLFLLIFVKYFDWFFSSLDKSVFFIGAGILLFILGWFMEKGRRYMISTIRSQSAPPQPQHAQQQ